MRKVTRQTLIRTASAIGCGLALHSAAPQALAQPEQTEAPAEQTGGEAPRAEKTPPGGGRDDVADLPQTWYDAEGQPPPRRPCYKDEDGELVCPRVYAVTGRSRPAKLAEAPWQASLWSFKYTDYTPREYQLKPEWLRRHKCGGTLIAAEWVLTAAHCVRGDLADHPFRVRIGATSLTDPRGKLFTVRETIVHPGYDAVNKQHDVALLRIDPVRLPGVRPVTLNGTRGTAQIADDAPATIFGFGKTRQAEGSALLLKAQIAVWPRTYCKARMGLQAGRITPAVLCAGSDDGTDTCQGDSGGPLVIGVGAKAVQVGVVSWGKGCGRIGVPGVYADVAIYLPWIWRVTGGKAGRATLPGGL